MSTPTVSPASPNDPTRQLLDELDALMERMLALPVDDPGGAEPLPPPRSHLWREPAVPPVSSIELPPPLTTRLESMQPTATPESAPPPTAAATTTSPPPIRTSPRWSPKTVLEGGSDAPLPELRTVWWVRPLLWSNRAFDRATLQLGTIGRWLRGETGRIVLGWTGLALLLLALTFLVCDVCGWSW